MNKVTMTTHREVKVYMSDCNYKGKRGWMFQLE
jgi:hypothetical protein